MSKSKAELIQQLASIQQEGSNEFGEHYKAVPLLPELKQKYPTQLRNEIVSVRMYQTEKACYLEITQNAGTEMMKNEYDIEITDENEFSSIITERSSLSFVANENGLYFKPEVPVAENAYLFLEEFDDTSKLNATDLFSEEGAEEIWGKINQNN